MSGARLIRAVGQVPGVARALRWWANRYPEGSVVTIRSGYAQGMRWKRSHQYVNGYWIGQHELEVQQAIARLLSPGDGFIDLGANAGFFTLVAARRVGPSGWCVAVDPDQFNCQYVQAQIDLNALGNCTVVQKAVAERCGVMKFALEAPGASTGRLSPDAPNAIEVPVTTLDELCKSRPRPALIKVDVEGAEVRVLQGATQTIQIQRPTWLIESHSRELARDVKSLLQDAGYRFETLAGEPIGATQELPYHAVAHPIPPGPSDRR